ncbi:hypothetical protein C5748_24820 [Phyllobacterium phragmitis]|uniref:ABC transporter permease n=1 Tax=Phyllobacterium phragmitis TaxID=2670329 RepID=A0A2S9IK02_9HYPH|nr:hypothetical protein [Phyllobacterium phragmitis]PRD40861.1 hypothetical protein C5748_24820 [Phyllobacterium phragmitis]
MLEFLLSFLTGPNGLFTGLGALLIAALGLYLKGRVDGGGLERSKQAEREAEARTVSDEIEDAIAGRDAGTNRERLKKWGR